jgi:hypothetical protein
MKKHEAEHMVSEMTSADAPVIITTENGIVWETTFCGDIETLAECYRKRGQLAEGPTTARKRAGGEAA